MWTLTTEIFVKEAKLIKNNLLNNDYSESVVSDRYTKVKIICLKHGAFFQRPTKHLAGQGCRKCAKVHSMTTEEFIAASKLIGNNAINLDYSETIRPKSSKDKVKLICIHHGEFYQIVGDHLQNKSSCPKCAGVYRPTLQEFIVTANIKHNNKFLYTNFIYVNAKTKGAIFCPVDFHGIFYQNPDNHLNGGKGCPKCATTQSKKEIAWLNSLNIKTMITQYRLPEPNLAKYLMDGYDPETNTVYEFHGDFWHGNPKKFNPDDINVHNQTSFKDLYNKTLLKEQEIKNAGYNLVVMWETDYEEIIKRNKVKNKTKRTNYG